jgi:hypothetical protein
MTDFGSMLLYVTPSLFAVTLVVNLLYTRQPFLKDQGVSERSGMQQATPLTLLQSKLPHHLGHDIICVNAKLKSH